MIHFKPSTHSALATIKKPKYVSPKISGVIEWQKIKRENIVRSDQSVKSDFKVEQKQQQRK